MYNLDYNLFTKTFCMSCVNDYKTTDSFVNAIETCASNEKCKMVFSTTCNDEGPFKLCENTLDLPSSVPNHCAYVKKGKKF